MVCPLCYVCASFDQRLKRLGVFEQQPVFDHARVIHGQRRARLTIRRELQVSADSGFIVDGRAIDRFLREEHALVVGNGIGEVAVGECDGGDARIVQSNNVVPVAGEALATQPFLQAKDVHCGRLLPEGPLGMHHPRARRWKLDAFDQSGRIARHIAWAGRLSRRAGTELQHHARSHIARSRRGRFIVDEQLVAFDPEGRGQRLRVDRTGKKLRARASEIAITFKEPPHSIFDDAPGWRENVLVIRLQPNEGMNLKVMIKEPGPGGMRLIDVPLDLTFADAIDGGEEDVPDAYERLIMDVIRGNQTLFMRGDEVEAAWAWTDPLIAGWEARNDVPKHYEQGSSGPEDALMLMHRDGRRWREIKG